MARKQGSGKPNKGTTLSGALGRGGNGSYSEATLQNALGRRESGLRSQTGSETLKGPLGR